MCKQEGRKSREGANEQRKKCKKQARCKQEADRGGWKKEQGRGNQTEEKRPRCKQEADRGSRKQGRAADGLTLAPR